ncbi:hypothetical protein IFM89_035035, partial [Coptis chinensis]
MLLRIKQQGLDIVPRILIVKRLLPDAVGATCNQRLEKVYGTEHSHILRVPFRTKKGILRKWISRIEVWPYLETFTEVRLSFMLILSSHTGNWRRIIGSSKPFSHCRFMHSKKLIFLVCIFLQCTIAHALEKTKYPNSDIYWKNFEEKYHFSCQFTAYLYAMNHTDFIILVHSRRLLEARTLLDSVRSLLISSLFVPPCWHHIHT